MPLYNTYGLNIDSELPLPEIPPASTPTSSIALRLGKVAFQSKDRFGRVLYKPISRSEVIVHYDGVGTALVGGGESILLQAASNADSLAVRLFVLQQVLGVALLQRGFLVLHASAASMNGSAVAFAGPSGEGKSTIVAALAEAGGQIVADDVLAIDRTNTNRPVALPGLVQLKLSEETRAEFGSRIISEQTIRDRGAKTLCEVAATRLTESTPLVAIYLLETGATLSLGEIPKARAAIELVRHTYGSRLLQALDLSQRHFEQSVALARAIPIFTLSRPRDLSLLPRMVDVIKQHLPS